MSRFIRNRREALPVFEPLGFGQVESAKANRVASMSEQPLRIATFNLESLDADALTARIAVLRPALVRLQADILCLQEVNGQRAARRGERRLSALSTLISETRYAAYQLVSTLTAEGHPAERHNLVILSRLPIISRAQIRHELRRAAALSACNGARRDRIVPSRSNGSVHSFTPKSPSEARRSTSLTCTCALRLLRL